MALTFTTTIPGTAGPLQPSSWGLSATPAKFFDVEGESMIIGQRGGRDIMCEHWLHNSYSTAALATAAMKALDALIGKEGTITNTLGQSFTNCVLVEAAQQMGPTNCPPLGYMWIVVLKWRQLKPPE
jgi:hypothetical protein